MSALKGTHIGFSYGTAGNLVHSSELGILHVSEGNRYTDNLIPTAQEKTTQVPGGDGTYYFGTYYTQKHFSLNIAFDGIDDTQLRTMRQLFGEKGIHQLIFDEMPYKIYSVRVSGAPNFKYIAFDIPDPNESSTYSADLYDRTDEPYWGRSTYTANGRLYKGEGNISFIAYTPFARSRYKYLDQYNNTTSGQTQIINIPEWVEGDDLNYYKNLDEWKDSVGLVNSTTSKTVGLITYVLDTPSDDGVLIYNPGDFDTPFIFSIQGLGIQQMPNVTLTVSGGNSITIRDLTLANSDTGYQINMKLNLIEGIDGNGAVTGTIYNRYIVNGDFFNMPIIREPEIMTYTAGSLTASSFGLTYDYLFY